VILSSNDQRIIFWGVKVYDTYVTAQLAYFAESIYSPTYQVGEYLLEIPESVRQKNLPSRAHNIRLAIAGR
jgi:hypothetical protein